VYQYGYHHQQQLQPDPTSSCIAERGCDGGRLYYDGCAMIVCNGQVLAQGKQFDVQQVQTVVAMVDLDDVCSYRASMLGLPNIPCLSLSSLSKLCKNTVILIYWFTYFQNVFLAQ
jgi:hypothetical protein